MNILKKNKVLTSRNNVSTSLITKTVKVTIGAPGVTGVDQNFTSAADKVEQSIQLTGADIIPTYAYFLAIVIACQQDWNGSAGDEADNQVEVGATSGGGEFIAATNLTNSGDITENSPASTATTSYSVYVSATPTTNNWDELTTGKLTVWVTYIDNNAV